MTSQKFLLRLRWRRRNGLLLLGGLLLALRYAAEVGGYRFNLSPSMPLGLWRVVATPPTDYRRGQAVVVCPPIDAPFLPRGGCPLGMQPLLKQLVGLPGDVVTVTPAGVSVNGQRLPHSAPLTQTADGQPLPQQRGSGRLNGFWLYGTDSPRSFDSRYFGAVPLHCLRGVVRPLRLF